MKTALSIFAISLLLFVLIPQQSSAQFKDWKPVTAAELQLSKSQVEPDADAEALLWDVYVADEDNGGSMQTVLRHYVKVKVFNERGREAFSKIDIQYGKIDGVGLNIQIKDIAARTTKPDGTVIELKSSDIFERDIVKGSGLKLKAKSFAVPGIEPGAVIEYRWKEVRGGVSFYQRLQFAREIPVQHVRYHIKPVPHPEYGMNGQPFNVSNSPFVKEKDGYHMTEVKNVPSFNEEPRMPPEYSIRPWMLLFYTKDTKIEPDKYWKDYGKKEYDSHKGLMKVSDEVKKAAAEAVGAETDPEKKVEKIFQYVRSTIKNPYDDRLNISSDELSKIKDNKNPSDTLKRGQGDGHDINMLFGAMAIGAGFEARSVRLPSRADVLFPKWFTDDYFMRFECVAVKIADAWKFFDPASRYTPFGMLGWHKEGQPALLADSKDPVWSNTPLSPPSKSVEKRLGRFKLLDDGTLEGTATMEFTGHLGAYHKEYNDDDTPQQREESLKRYVKHYILGSAEVSDISIENVTDPDKPFTYIFKIRVPGYATRTGKRIFLQPNVFERSAKPMFESNSRRHEVFFDYPYTERDEIEIELPQGYELENPDAPGIVQDTSGIVVNDVKISVTSDKRVLIYKRSFTFGNKPALFFDRTVYPALKGLFERIYQANNHALTLRQSAAAATTVK